MRGEQKQLAKYAFRTEAVSADFFPKYLFCEWREQCIVKKLIIVKSFPWQKENILKAAEDEMSRQLLDCSHHGNHNTTL